MHALDTHKAVTRLETAGLSRQTAEAVVEIFDTASNVATADLISKVDTLTEKQEKLATKAALEKIEKDMAALATKDAVEKIEKDMAALATKAAVEKIEKDMAALATKAAVEKVEKDMATKAELKDLATEVQSLTGRVENIEKNMATKAELVDLKVDIIRWNIGVVIAFAALMIASAKLL